MILLLNELCKELNNWFEISKLFGNFEIKDGTMNIDGVKDGQYIRICGSTFNDGVIQYPLSDLKDETFNGSVWILNIPPDVIDLSDEIDTWNKKYSKRVNSPYKSESFGGYSYSLKSGDSGDGSVTWQSVFSRRLNRWRKL